MKTDGVWLYTQDDCLIRKVFASQAWEPQKNSGSKYGCGVYLSRTPWHSHVHLAIECRVVLPDNAVMNVFLAEPGWQNEGDGNSYKHFGRYLKGQGLCSANHPATQSGSSNTNVAVREHFLALGIKAVIFNEHGQDNLVVYDPVCITMCRIVTL